MSALARTVLSTPERQLLGLLALGQTPAEAAKALRLAPEQAESMLADLLRRNCLSARRQLLTRALVHRWI